MSSERLEYLRKSSLGQRILFTERMIDLDNIMLRDIRGLKKSNSRFTLLYIFFFIMFLPVKWFVLEGIEDPVTDAFLTMLYAYLAIKSYKGMKKNSVFIAQVEAGMKDKCSDLEALQNEIMENKNAD